MTEELTWQEFWQLAEEAEQRRKIESELERMKRSSRDKAVDWDWESFTWEKWNPRNFK
jgi:hypothetical protein